MNGWGCETEWCPSCCVFLLPLFLNAVPQTSTEWSCSTTEEVPPVWTPAGAAATPSASSWKAPSDRSALPLCSTTVRTRKHWDMSSGVWCPGCAHFNMFVFCRLCCSAIGPPVWSLEVQWKNRTSSAASCQHQRGRDLHQRQVRDHEGGARHQRRCRVGVQLQPQGSETGSYEKYSNRGEGVKWRLVCCVLSVLMF